MTTITEADVEQVALDWLSGLGWQVTHGPDIAPDASNAERDDYGGGRRGAETTGHERTDTWNRGKTEQWQ